MNAQDRDIGQSGRIDFLAQENEEWFAVTRSLVSGSTSEAVGRITVKSDNLDAETSTEHCFFALARDGYSDPDDGPSSAQYKQTACKVCVTVNNLQDTPPLFFNQEPINGTFLTAAERCLNASSKNAQY